MENKQYRQSYDAVLLSYSILRRLGCGSVSTFADRIRAQKIQYLAQTVGVSPAYQFNLYLRGPYSPDLAHDLFKITEQKIVVNTDKFASDELEEDFSKLESFIKGKDTRELELVTTLHWLVMVVRKNKEGAGKILKEWKNASDEEIEISFKQLALI